MSVVAGMPANFQVKASGSPDVSFLWQVSSDGGANWIALASRAATLTIDRTELAQNGFRYRAVVTNRAGFTTSTSAVLTVADAGQSPGIVVPPGDANVVAGESAVFSVTANGVPSPSHRWETSTDGGVNWTPSAGLAGAETATFVTHPTTLSDGCWVVHPQILP